MVSGVVSLTGSKLSIPSRIRKFSIAFALLQPIVFYPAWIIQLIPLMANARKIENLYSIYILDLCFIMPAFIVVVIMIVQKKDLGLLLMPAMFILGFTLIFSLAVSESVKPFFDQAANVASQLIALVLLSLFLLAAVLHLRSLIVEDPQTAEYPLSPTPSLASSLQASIIQTR